jgi:hypothetical protein
MVEAGEPEGGPQPQEQPEPSQPVEVHLQGVAAQPAVAPIFPTSASGAGSGYAVRTTLPDELLRHDISDEELDQLGDTQRGFFHEAMWSCIAGAVGASWGAIDALHEAYWATPAVPISLYGVWEIVVFAVFTAFAAFCVFMVRRERTRPAIALKEKIRARTRSKLGLAQ